MRVSRVFSLINGSKAFKTAVLRSYSVTFVSSLMVCIHEGVV